ncbi:MAG: S9 family peptidase, partial [Chitinophagaceae bacterium]|nr:S9 family peptidase [Chitinophagaceae bacterium]
KRALAFTIRATGGSLSIWNYTMGARASSFVIADHSLGMGDDFYISGLRDFSYSGEWLFFYVRKQLPSLLPDTVVTTSVDVWSYRDEVILPAQHGEPQHFSEYAVALNLRNKKIQLVEKEDNEKLSCGLLLDDYCVLEKGGSRNSLTISQNTWWPHDERLSYWLLSLNTGQRKLIKTLSENLGSLIQPICSPKGRWFLYWDMEQQYYFSLDPLTGKLVNMTLNLPTSFGSDVDQLVANTPAGLLGWYNDESAVLVYDNYDIWKLDPSGDKPAMNITEGYGRRGNIKFRVVYPKETYKGDEELLLSAFDMTSKYNGFYTVVLNKPGSLKKLSMGPYHYYQPAIQEQNFSGSMQPLTGGEGKNKRWIVLRQSATEYPNFYVSKDLKEFTALTHLQPHKKYNWLTSEAVSWRMYNGQVNTGVLYKPEDFDSTKKYPVIFNYYEKFAQRCYEFPMPGLTTDNINIPWFVNRGYLVFTPDIQYTAANQPGGMTISEAAYNSVASAAEYLSQRSYVDRAHLGIQGHSFGGHETNGIITYSGNLFAAAAEVAGFSDPISAYLTLVQKDEISKNGIEEVHHVDHANQRMGASPWECPDLFKKNSPVLNSDKIATPLLIAHNQKDCNVNYRQGVEMYMAMRRLGKPCWMLQYDNSGHVIADEKDALDYTIRLTQYFDHYLKGQPAPRWMTMNTLAYYKGKNNLYELDPAGNCMKECKVCKEWNAKQATTANK